MADRPVSDSSKSRKDLKPIDWTTFRYMHDDPMYAYCQKKKEQEHEEKLDRVKQLQALLDSDSNSSDEDQKSHRKHKKHKKDRSSKKAKKKKSKKNRKEIDSDNDAHKVRDKSKHKSDKKRKKDKNDSDDDWIEVTDKHVQKKKKLTTQIREQQAFEKVSNVEKTDNVDTDDFTDVLQKPMSHEVEGTEPCPILDAIREIRYSHETWHKIKRRPEDS